MTMRLTISHETQYNYEEPVAYGLQQIRLRPKSRAGQTVLSWDITVEGGRVETSFEDQHSNHVSLVSIEPGTDHLIICCDGEVETEDRSGVVGSHGGWAPLWLFNRSTPATKAGPSVRALVRALGTDYDTDLVRLHALSGLIADRVQYEIGITDAETTAEQALDAEHGVCQDHAHIFISAARLMGFPARYVSGYLMMNDRIEQEAGHAWAEAHVDGLGWVGFDVSNCLSPDARYVRVATGLDYGEAAPLSGLILGETAASMAVALQVQQ